MTDKTAASNRRRSGLLLTAWAAPALMVALAAGCSGGNSTHPSDGPSDSGKAGARSDGGSPLPTEAGSTTDGSLPESDTGPTLGAPDSHAPAPDSAPATTDGAMSMAPNPGTAQDMVTFQYGNLRQGWDDHETTLTPSNIGASTFGKVGFDATDGDITSQPLYLGNVVIPGHGMHNVVYVVTDANSVFAFDADDGSTLWQVTATMAGESPGHGCADFLDQVGISATPVIDRSQGPNGAIYVAPMTTDASNASHQRLWALDVATGAPLFGSPVEVRASYTPPGGTAVTLDPSAVAEVAALMIVNGVLYTSWGDACEYTYPDHGGWVIGYDEGTLAQTSVFNTTPNGSGGIVWLGAGAPGADADGNLYYPTGMGSFDSSVDGNGLPAQGDYANSVLKLALQGGSLQVVDYFHTPEGGDFTQMGTVLFDATDAQGATHHLLGQVMGGDLFILDRDNLGKTGSSFQYLAQGDWGGGYTGGPAFWNGVLFYTAQWDPLRPLTTTGAVVAYRGDQPPDGQGTGTPTVSSNGSGPAILWKVDHLNTGQLFHAYDPGNLATVLYSSDTNAARDGLTPPTEPNLPQNSALTVANGKVYVPDGNTHGLAVYGLLQ